MYYGWFFEHLLIILSGKKYLVGRRAMFIVDGLCGCLFVAPFLCPADVEDDAIYFGVFLFVVFGVSDRGIPNPPHRLSAPLDIQLYRCSGSIYGSQACYLTGAEVRYSKCES